MKTKLTLAIAAASLATLSVSEAAVTYVTGTTSISGSTNGLDDSNGNATGTFSTTAVTGSAGISFDLSISASGTLGGQSGGLGVVGGSTDAAIDNNGGSGPQEGIILFIDNFSGLAAGESLVITHVRLSFGANGGETYDINNSGNIGFLSSPQTIDIDDTDFVFVNAGTAGDTKFTISAFTVEVIPEPSAAMLGALGGFALLARRRR